MKKVKEFEKIKEQVEKAKAKRNADVAEYTKRLAAAEADKAAAEDAIKAATISGIAADYTKAKAAYREAEDLIEFYTGQIQNAEESKLFETEEANKVIRRLKEVIESERVKVFEEAQKDTDRVIADLEEFKEMATDGHGVIKELRGSADNTNWDETGVIRTAGVIAALNRINF